MEQNQLFGAMSTFVVVADCGSFSEAGRRLGLSQPSISRQINSLETHLGVQLLQRTTRKVSLTEAGVIYCEKARQIQADVDEAGQAVNAFKQQPTGKLRVGLPIHWVDLKIAPYLPEFFQLYPEIQLDLIATDYHQDLVRDNLDLVIRIGKPRDSSYVAVPIAPVALTLCAAPSYLEKHGTPKTYADLSDHNCLRYDRYSQWQFKEPNQTQPHNLKVSGNLVTNQVTVLIRGALDGLGIVLLPDLLLKPMLDSGDLVHLMSSKTITIRDASIEHMFALYSNRRHLAAKTRVFIDFFKEKITQWDQ